MKILRQFSGCRKLKRPVCLAAGFFDGLHVGHQEVLRRTIAEARRIGGEAWAMTFDPHPLKILAPKSAPLLLTDTPHKLRLFKQFGMDGCLVIPFNAHFANTTASAFLDLLERDIPALHSVFMGHDWRFGHKGQGDFAMLETWAKPREIRVFQVPAVMRGGKPVSSTRIRNAVGTGNLNEASTLLGRPFSILGKVVPGNRIGRKLGYPTANLSSGNEAYPPTGIYAVQAIIGRRVRPGVANYGHHPTIAKTRTPLLELHLLDLSMNLYQKQVEVFFLRRIREEIKFACLPDLMKQIGNDIKATRKALKSRPLNNLWIKTLQRWHPGIIVPPKQIREKTRDKKGNRAQLQYGCQS